MGKQLMIPPLDVEIVPEQYRHLHEQKLFVPRHEMRRVVRERPSLRRNPLSPVQQSSMPLRSCLPSAINASLLDHRIIAPESPVDLRKPREIEHSILPTLRNSL